MVVDKADVDLPPSIREGSADNLILGVALFYKRHGKDVVFVTKDTNLRVKADALGVPAEDYETDKVQIDELYAGWRSITVPRKDAGRPLLQQGHPLHWGFHPNEMALLVDEENPSHTALARHVPADNALAPVEEAKPLWGSRRATRSSGWPSSCSSTRSSS